MNDLKMVNLPFLTLPYDIFYLQKKEILLTFEKFLSINNALMTSYRKSHLCRSIIVTTALAALASCASIGNPTGGPRDEDPPVFIRSNPEPGAVNVNRQRIELEFDEIVNVKDAFTNVVVSPPFAQVPRVSSLGRKVRVDFNDTLPENTTVTIDFGNSIEDNNENNKLQGFSFTFSTGPEIDTLQLSGMVLGARDLEPQQGMLVGVYSNLADTAFATLPFERMAKTDDYGHFTIRGLSPGNYRIFALKDLDNDYHRANPEEAMAFYDVTLSPLAERTLTTDTIYNLKTGDVDTVLSRERTLFLPNDILLRSFESDYKSQYLQKYERLDSTRLSLIFNAPSDSIASVTPVGYEHLKDWYVLEKSVKNDSLTFWITEPSILGLDSLRVATRYFRLDSTNNLAPVVDTLRFFYPRTMKTALANAAKEKEKAEKERLKEIEKKLKAGEEVMPEDTLPEKPTPLGIKVLSSTTMDVYAPILLEFETPLTRLDTNAFSLEVLIDTIWEPVPLPWRPVPADSVTPRRLMIEYPWEFSSQYRLLGDSLAATGIYGLETDPLLFSFKTKSEDDYSSIIFNISNFTDSVPAFIEILNSSDVPVKRVPLTNNKAVAEYLTPGKYYARIFEDFNGNGIFDTGNYEAGILPDMAYYYPKMINLKKNWEREESWDVFSTAVDLMKPEEIKKNKADADKKKRVNQNRMEEEEEEDYYDPTRNPFDPNDRGRNNYR